MTLRDVFPSEEITQFGKSRACVSANVQGTIIAAENNETQIVTRSFSSFSDKPCKIYYCFTSDALQSVSYSYCGLKLNQVHGPDSLPDTRKLYFDFVKKISSQLGESDYYETTMSTGMRVQSNKAYIPLVIDASQHKGSVQWEKHGCISVQDPIHDVIMRTFDRYVIKPFSEMNFASSEFHLGYHTPGYNMSHLSLWLPEVNDGYVAILLTEEHRFGKPYIEIGHDLFSNLYAQPGEILPSFWHPFISDCYIPMICADGFSFVEITYVFYSYYQFNQLFE